MACVPSRSSRSSVWGEDECGHRVTSEFVDALGLLIRQLAAKRGLDDRAKFSARRGVRARSPMDTKLSTEAQVADCSGRLGECGWVTFFSSSQWPRVPVKETALEKSPRRRELRCKRS